MVVQRVPALLQHTASTSWALRRASRSMAQQPQGPLKSASGLVDLTDKPFARVLQEDIVHQSYMTVSVRTVEYPGAQDQEPAVHRFDLVSHPHLDFQFAVVFPFHPHPRPRRGGEVTLLQEFCQGPNELLWSLPAGGFSPGKHADREACARAELSEEAHLRGGEWHALIPPTHPGLAEVKWCKNRFTPFLAIDPQADPSPGAREAEEACMQVHRVSVEAFRDLARSGDMMLPSVSTGFLALERLGQLGYL